MYRLLWLGMLALLLGCGPRPTKGGTPGTLKQAGLPLVDVQVHVYRHPSLEAVGFGITAAEGKFQLFTIDAKGPLLLSPGDYAISLESVGAEPLHFASELLGPATTPLRKSWSAGDTSLDIEISAPTLNASPVPR